MRSLYVQVLLAIAVGCVLGYTAPASGAAMKPLGDGFIKMIKMIRMITSSHYIYLFLFFSGFRIFSL